MPVAAVVIAVLPEFIKEEHAEPVHNILLKLFRFDFIDQIGHIQFQENVIVN